jgi:hypothetical protein
MPLIQVGGWRGGQRKIEPVFAEIDDDDLERVSHRQWSPNTSSSKHTTYAQTILNGKKIHLHRFIMGLGDFKDDKRIVDHKDGNGLNNKKDNLVICDNLYNSQSFRRHHGENNVGLVYFDTSMKRVKRWRATITLMGVRHHKRFLTEQEAKGWITEVRTLQQCDDPHHRTPSSSS